MRLLIAIACLSITPAFAQVWAPMGETTDGTMYMDLTSFRQQGRFVKAWEKWVLKEPAASKGYPQFTYRSSKTLSYYDCSAGTYAPKQTVYFDDEDGAGRNVYNYNLTEAQLNFQDPIPGTIGRAMFDMACPRKK